MKPNAEQIEAELASTNERLKRDILDDHERRMRRAEFRESALKFILGAVWGLIFLFAAAVLALLVAISLTKI